MAEPNTYPQTPTLLLILGMHRSGTSAIAKGVESLGLSLGEYLLGAAPDNPKGYWEDAEGVALNQKIFDRCDLRWNEARILDTDDLLARTQDLRRAARDLLASRISCWHRWAFKDPRTLRTLPIWLEAAAELQLDTRALLVLRHPQEVCASLAVRNQMNPLRAQLMWAAHWLPFLPRLRGRPLAVIDYEQVITAPVPALEKVAGRLGYSVDAQQLRRYGESFLDVTLRHHRASGDTPLLPLVTDAYDLLRACGELSEAEFWSAWEGLQERHREWMGCYALLDAETDWRRRRRSNWWRWTHGQWRSVAG